MLVHCQLLFLLNVIQVPLCIDILLFCNLDIKLFDFVNYWGTPSMLVSLNLYYFILWCKLSLALKASEEPTFLGDSFRGSSPWNWDTAGSTYDTQGPNFPSIKQLAIVVSGGLMVSCWLLFFLLKCTIDAAYYVYTVWVSMQSSLYW